MRSRSWERSGSSSHASYARRMCPHRREGVERAERYLRWEERQQVARAEAKWNTYVERLARARAGRAPGGRSETLPSGDNEQDKMALRHMFARRGGGKTCHHEDI